MRIALSPAALLCLLSPLALSHAASPPSFSEDVAAIIFGNCTECHRPGEPAPFPLTNYTEVKRRGQMIAEVTGDGFMPPWHPSPDHLTFQNERRLSSDQIDTLYAWYEAGMPEGDPTKAPALPDFPEGWRLGEPDLILEMREGFEVPADGPDIYRSFAVPIQLPEDRWVSAVEVRAGDGGVLHHTLLFLDASGTAIERDGKDGRGPGFKNMDRGDAGSLGGWAVGAGPKRYPDGLAMKLPAGTDLILSSHLHPNGKATTEITKIGLFFAEEEPTNLMVGFQAPPNFGASAGINIPAGDSDYTITDSVEMPCDVELIQVGGHMHYIGKSCKATATLPDGSTQALFEVPRWDFNWQDSYLFAEPVALPAGTKIDVEIAWDNSADNPFNPHDPPKRVRWGKESTDEMGSISFLVVAEDPDDHPALITATRGKSTGLAGGENITNIRETLRERLGSNFEDRIRQGWVRLDANKDGDLQEDEIPERLRALLMRGDTNNDGTLTPDEATAMREES